MRRLIVVSKQIAASQEAVPAASRADGWFGKYIGRDASSDREGIDPLAYNADHNWAATEQLVAESGDAHEAQSKIRALYRRFIKRAPSRAQPFYSLRKLSGSQLLLVRHPIATRHADRLRLA